MLQYFIGISVCIAGIFFIRMWAKERLNPSIVYGLWLILIIRMMLPFHYVIEMQSQAVDIISDRESYIPDEDAEKNSQNGGMYDLKSEKADPDHADDTKVYENTVVYKELQDGESEKSDIELSGVFSKDTSMLKKCAVIIWCFGMLILVIYFVTKNCFFRHQLYKKRKIVQVVNKNTYIYSVNMPMVPFMYGIRKCEIYINDDIAQHIELKENIYAHELVHWKRKDNLWLLAAKIIVIIHWFNPLVWAAYRAYRSDCELACDYEVVKNMDDKGTMAYGRTMIYLASERKNSFDEMTVSCMSYGRIKMRIEALGRVRQAGRIMKVPACIMSVIVLAVSLISCVKVPMISMLQNDEKLKCMNTNGIQLENVSNVRLTADGGLIFPGDLQCYIGIEDYEICSGQAGTADDYRHGKINLEDMSIHIEDEAPWQKGRWIDTEISGRYHYYWIDEKIYFYDRNEDGNICLMSARADGSDLTMVCQFTEETEPYLVWYFMAYDKDKHNVYIFANQRENDKLPLSEDYRALVEVSLEDGTMKKVGYIPCDVDMGHFGVTGDLIIFQTASQGDSQQKLPEKSMKKPEKASLCIYSLSDKKATAVTLDNMSPEMEWTVNDGYLYYKGVDDNSVLKMDLTTGKEDFVLEDAGARAIPKDFRICDEIWDDHLSLWWPARKTYKKEESSDKSHQSSNIGVTQTFQYKALDLTTGQISDQPVLEKKHQGTGLMIVAEYEHQFIINDSFIEKENGMFVPQYGVIRKDDYYTGNLAALQRIIWK